MGPRRSAFDPTELGPWGSLPSQFATLLHSVRHDGSSDSADMFHDADGNVFKVAVMLRTACFRAARGRTSSSPPGPKIVFELVSEAVFHALAAAQLRVPSLQECLEMLKPE